MRLGWILRLSRHHRRRQPGRRNLLRGSSRHAGRLRMLHRMRRQQRLRQPNLGRVARDDRDDHRLRSRAGDCLCAAAGMVRQQERRNRRHLQRTAREHRRRRRSDLHRPEGVLQPRQQLHRDRVAHSIRNSDRDAYCDPNPNQDCDSHRNRDDRSNHNRNSNCNGYRDGNSHGDRHRNTDYNRNTDYDRDGHHNRDGDRHRDSDSDGNRY